jgi:DNA-binding SARP family transcriptional activator/Tfp pilus assembly protein PilF
MRAALSVTLFGGTAFRWGDGEVRPAARKALALLVFLALRPNGADRGELAELLWSPGRLGSVRQALYELRKLRGAEAWLQLDGSRVRVLARTDVAEFERLCADGEHVAALELWRGALAQVLDSVAAPPFVEWLDVERARLDTMRIDALLACALELESEGLQSEALGRVEQLIAIDSLNENAHRVGMRLLYRLGRRRDAQALFARCRERLRRDLDVAPQQATVELADAIDRGRPLPMSASLWSLDDRLRRVVQALAVARGALRPRVLAAVVGRDSLDVADDLERLMRVGVLDAHHELPREMLLEARTLAPPAVARVLHERIATALEAGGGSETRVARHWLGAHEPDRAAPLLLRAARAAAEEGADVAAERRAYRALWASTDRGVRFDALLLLEGVAEVRRDRELQDAALAAAEESAWASQDDRSLLEVRLRRSRVHLRRGRLQEALKLARRAAASAERLAQPALVARAGNAVGAALFFSGQLAAAREAFAENEGAEEAVERYQALNNLGALTGLQGDLETSYRYFERALTVARATGRHDDVAESVNNLAATAERMGDYDRAHDHLADAVRLARRHASRLHEDQVLVNLAAVNAKIGELGPAWNTAAEVEASALERCDGRVAVQAADVQADVARQCGAFERARACLARARSALGDDDPRRSLQLQAAETLLDVSRRSHPPGDRAWTRAMVLLDALRRANLDDAATRLACGLAMTAPPGVASALLGKEGVGNRPPAADGERDVTATAINPHRALLMRAGRFRVRWGAPGDGDCAEAAELAAIVRGSRVTEAPFLLYLLGALARCPDLDADALRGEAERLGQEMARGLPRELAASLAASLDRYVPGSV